jgi:3-hydroxyisobutyrate dehydrogenase-like beta-hydroxyacid dehydrogenase
MRVAVVGLGKMGEPIARRLLGAGHELTVFNRTPGRAAHLVEHGAREVSTARDVWATADICITMVADDRALRAVTQGEHGVLADAVAGRTLIDMSTVSPTGSAQVAAAAADVGVVFLRAPVSGAPPVVEAGNLGVMVSGDRETFERLEPMLRDIGPNVFYLGAGDEARVMKLALNLIIAGTGELMAEALVLGEASGLDRSTMLEVMGASAIGSPFVKYKTPGLVADNYAALFTTTAMHKDLTLALEAGGAVDASLPATALVHGLLEDCISAGMADLDFMTLFPLRQREAGLEPAVTI